MNRTQRFVCLAVLLAAVFAFALPHSSSAVDDWLPVPPEDLALKDNPASPGAHAMILYRNSAISEKYVNTDGETVSEYFRTKIFTKEGVEYGNVEIPYLKDFSDVRDIRARTIRPDGTIVNFEGKPFEKLIQKHSGEKFLAKTFSLPDVQPGCIIEYKYRVQYKPRYLVPQNWVLSSELFMREGHFSIYPYASNYENFPLYWRQFGLAAKTKTEKQPDGTYALVVHDIPGIADEPNMPPLRTIEARVDFYHLDDNQPSQEPQDHFWTRTEKKWNDDMEHFISKKGVLTEEVSKTVSPSDPPEVKVRKIYARAQQIRDLSYEKSRTEKEVKAEDLKKNSNVEDLLKHGYGNGREVNYLMVGLARAAGFESSEVFVAPRNNNFFYPQMQDASEVTADVVWVRAGDKDYYVDPGSAYFPFGVLPWYETNTSGVRLSAKLEPFVNIPVSLSSDATIVRHAELAITDEGLASGKLSVDFTGQKAALRREENRLQDDTGRKKNLEDEIKGWLPAGSDFELKSIDNWDKMDQPLHVEGTLKLGNFGSAVGHRMLIPATCFVLTQHKTFESAIRRNAVYFEYPHEEIDTVKFEAPPGFKIETLPAVKPSKPGSGVVSYDLSATQQGNGVEVKRHLVIDGLIFPPEYYAALRSFFNSVKSNDEAQIVFQNAETAKN
jgi:hypothetical protein